ncbi:phosphoribosylamine--glycine ligase [Facklamia miroungae]|uniref:Phosphoribosylamine--glycine ligase n=1 Tax=Facklamia miroungae TaxID=120956 RepID=A0A1G7P7S5_9LACT|nr:phosphoribosylamine--glycine ligase [Facklamia miroungae]NKZ28592.1 phosphoribosylamine--glycine ligase [Facklamia miroungae]SDF81659.1 phosphoribosylamine--glycine ligase [Facklamia miroungae]
MKLLVIGSGGREHAIAYHLLKSPMVESVFCAPGNPGMKADGISCVNISEYAFEDLITFAKKEQIDWTFVGPEGPLFEGIVDQFTQAGQIAFGPNQAAAQIEGSKLFAKELMQKYGIPTASYASFTDQSAALSYLDQQSVPIVVKVDGPAAGKGVTVALTKEEAEKAIKSAFEKDSSQQRLVIEECLIGPEFSIFSMVYKGKVCHSLPARDHKRLLDGNLGPNTGGMGAFAPVGDISEDLYQETLRTIVEPVLVAMEKEGTPFNGVLYTGLMNTAEGPKVIEFNARFGDPETQVVLPLLKTDFAELINDLLHGRETQVEWMEDKACLGVILAAEGYPAKPIKGIEFALTSLMDPSMKIYYAGVSSYKPLISSGGRIAMITCLADSKDQAQKKVYQYLAEQDLKQIIYRKDIGSFLLKS